MKIPEKIKIGGKTYEVEIDEKLDLGTQHYSAEILYNSLKIRITPQAQQKMEADFLHEVMHAIYAHLGYSDHDEKQVEELAEALYMVIQDNPCMFKGEYLSEDLQESEDTKQ